MGGVDSVGSNTRAESSEFKHRLWSLESLWTTVPSSQPPKTRRNDFLLIYAVDAKDRSRVHFCKGFTCIVKVSSAAMKPPGEGEGQRLGSLLLNTLAREERLWRTPVLKNGCVQGSDISPHQYHEVIVWLREMSSTFQFSSETFALGVCVLNSLLATVKTQLKYFKCMAITSLILAAKINEEDEVIASVKDLLEQSRCRFSTAEILRMERVILNKLHWDLYIATPVDFIHIFHGLLKSRHPQLMRAGAQNRPCLQASLWTRQVQHCMACHQLWQFKGSILALAIITLELERLTPDWFSVFTDLLRKAQIESTEFICCKEMVDEYLTSLELSVPTNAVYILDATSMLAFRGQDVRDGDGKTDGDQDMDDFYDGLWCLYDEEPSMKTGRHGLQDVTSPCPPLRPSSSQ